MTAYVEAQLWAFDWPGDEGYKRQYRDLMSAWSRLSEEDDIAKRVFLAEGRFDWLVWWKLSHTDPRFLPSGCEAIFAVYHFMGMVGVSEAKAESVASLLKRYKGNSPLGTDRIIEKAILRNCGVDGLSFDDVFLTRCWVEYFGGMEKDKFSFRVQAENRRTQKFPLGGGLRPYTVISKGGRWKDNARGSGNVRVLCWEVYAVSGN